MKKILFAAFTGTALLFASCGNGAPKAEFKNEVDTLSYEMGLDLSNQLTKEIIYANLTELECDSACINEFLKGFKDALNGSDNKEYMAYIFCLSVGLGQSVNFATTEGMIFADDKEKTLNRNNILAGYIDGLKGDTALMLNGKSTTMHEFGRDINKRMREMAKEANTAFIAKKAQEKGIKKLPGGTLYRVIKDAKGEKVQEGQTLNLVYEGRFANGKVFDASANHSYNEDKTVEWPVGRGIPGFEEALKAMPVGATWEIYIPYEQGYGDMVGRGIPPYSALVFTITIKSIKK